MEEYVKRLIENTFKNHDFEKAKQIIADKILWYEMRIKELEDIINTDDEEGK